MSKRLITLAAFCAVLFTCPGYSQEKSTSLQRKILDKNYKFIAMSSMSLSGGTRQLTSEYTLRVSGDSVIAYLPYFGVAYSAPVNSSEGGIKFISTHSIYKITNRKKGGWDITIKPTDVSDVQQLYFTIFTNGSASLQVTSTNRQSITFNGNISD